MPRHPPHRSAVADVTGGVAHRAGRGCTSARDRTRVRQLTPSPMDYLVLRSSLFTERCSLYEGSAPRRRDPIMADSSGPLIPTWPHSVAVTPHSAVATDDRQPGRCQPVSAPRKDNRIFTLHAAVGIQLPATAKRARWSADLVLP